MVKIDKNLVFLYSENSRIKIKDISSLLKKSSQRLKYSIKVIEKDGIIHNTHCIFDYSYFGLILFRVYFKGGYVGEKDKATIIKNLSENPYIVSVYELSGEFDLAIEIESPNPSRFNKEIKRIAELIPTLNNYKMILNLVTYIYPRAYLPKDQSLIDIMEKEIIIGGDREVQSFNSNELSILKNLLESPQIRMTSLAKNSSMNVKTAVSILKELNEKKVIRGFKSILSAAMMDVYRFRLFLKLHNLSQERSSQLMDFMMKTKEIGQLNKTVGDWDMEVDIESLDKARIRQITVQLRENFKDIIESFNIIEFYKYYKKSYLPKYLFE